jgi:hypothetical protein
LTIDNNVVRIDHAKNDHWRREKYSNEPNKTD